jgi:DNA-binding transcriptional MocR family regulator
MPINSFEDYPLTWQPDRSQLSRPVYRALLKQLVDAINNGTLLPGTKLPSQRELADYLDLNFTTITRVYKLSQEQGLTYGITGKGTFIAQNASAKVTISLNRQPELTELGFLASFESTNQLMEKVTQQVLHEAHLARLLTYAEPTGTLTHKRVALTYLKRVGVSASLDQLVVTSGGQNALALIIFGLFEPGDRLAVDSFTYTNLIEVAKMHHLQLVPVASDSEGLLADALAEICATQTIKGIYLIPDFSNPRGLTYTEARRRQLAEIIRQHGLILIEDDYQSFMTINQAKPLPKLSQLVPEQALYVCSMSKPLSSGLRVAYLVVAAQYQQALQRALFNINVKTSALDVEVITQALLSGVAYQMIGQKQRLVKLANQQFDQVFHEPAPATLGLFRWLPINDCGLSGDALEQRFRNAGISVFHSDRFLVGPRPAQTYLRISLASEPMPKLTVGLVRLKELLVSWGLWQPVENRPQR